MDYSNGKTVGVVAVAIAILALGISFFGGSSQPSQNVGGERAGLQEFIDGIKAGDINAKWVSAKLPTQENSVLIYANRTGHDVIADFGSMTIVTGETASSTYDVSIFATTSSSIAASNNFADFGDKSCADTAATVATSSTATTTNSINSAALGQGIGAIVVPTGSFIFDTSSKTCLDVRLPLLGNVRRLHRRLADSILYSMFACMRFYRVLHHCSALTNGTRKGSGVRAVPQKLITYTLMKNILTIAIWVAVALAVIGGLWYLYDSISDVVSPNVGGAQSGLPTTVVLNPATTTSLTVNTTAALIFASSTCNSRIITTYASPIMIGLTDKFHSLHPARVAFYRRQAQQLRMIQVLWMCRMEGV